MKLTKFNLHNISIAFGIFFFCVSKIGLADSSFNTDTRILIIPTVNFSNGESFQDVKLKFDFTKGQFTLLNAAPVNTVSPASTGLTSCVDGYPKGACTILADEGIAQYVRGSSCSSSFPQLTYLPPETYQKPYTSISGSCVFIECGTCGFGLNKTGKLSKQDKDVVETELKEIENIVIESFLESQD